jgi:carbamoyltransferase
MLVLGIHFGHGSSAVLVREGRVLAAIEEEKLNREKGYVGFPFLAMNYVLEEGNATVEDVDHVAIGAENIAEFSYNFIHLTYFVFRRTNFWLKKFSYLLDAFHYLFHRWDSSAAVERMFYYYLESVVNIPREKVVKVDHHLAHAASAYYCSPWKDAVVFTADGKGDGLCGGTYVGDEKGFHCLDRVSDRYSAGQFYQAVTKYLGYRVNRHEGKITGLAAYGDYRKTAKAMRQVLGVNEQGEMYNTLYENASLERDPVKYYEREVANKSYMSTKYIRLLNGELRKYGIVHQLYQNHILEEMGDCSPEDLAAGVQRLAEDFLTAYARDQLEGHLPCNVCLAGGVFANVKINQRIREIEGVKGLYVQPAMDDAGSALGAALHVVAEKGGYDLFRQLTLGAVYQGPGYSEEAMEAQLRQSGISYRRPSDTETEIAKLLDEGKIIGRYTGRLEWGPRALGNRSILVRPTEKSINDVLNKRLNRTEFMPFAPSMLAEYAADYLIGYSEADSAARFMTVTYSIHPDKVQSIDAAVHVDGTARPQVVFREDNETFHKIIEAYHRISGIPAVVNTSFNMHEEPIVNTPDDAIRAYQSGAVDVLSLGPFIVDGDIN